MTLEQMHKIRRWFLLSQEYPAVFAEWHVNLFSSNYRDVVNQWLLLFKHHAVSHRVDERALKLYFNEILRNIDGQDTLESISQKFDSNNPLLAICVSIIKETPFDPVYERLENNFLHYLAVIKTGLVSVTRSPSCARHVFGLELDSSPRIRSFSPGAAGVEPANALKQMSTSRMLAAQQSVVSSSPPGGTPSPICSPTGRVVQAASLANSSPRARDSRHTTPPASSHFSRQETGSSPRRPQWDNSTAPDAKPKNDQTIYELAREAAVVAGKATQRSRPGSLAQR